MKDPFLSRRDFLKTSGALATGAALAASAPSFLTAAERKRSIGANDRIRIAILGCGNRGRVAHMQGIYKHLAATNFEIVAVCDSWRVHREQANGMVKEWFGRDAQQFTNYRDLFAAEGIDAVMIATPDHHHTTHLEAAAKAGKHIYVEKPLATEMDKLVRAYDAAKIAQAAGCIIQVGTQLRSLPSIAGARELLKIGILFHLAFTMSVKTVYGQHVQTMPNRSHCYKARSRRCSAGARRRRTQMRASHSLAGLDRRHVGGNRGSAWRGSSQCSAIAGAVSTTKRCGQSRAQELGRSATRALDLEGRGEVFGPLGGTSPAGENAGCVLVTSRVCPKCRPTGGGDRCISDVGAPWLAQGSARHPAPGRRSEGAGRLEKKLPQMLADLLDAEPVKPRRVRLMFQDEARFGRMVRIKRCWAPVPLRPVVDNGYERQFTYVYGAISPREGELDWMICEKMNTERMNEFLAQVSAAHPRTLIIMIMDGASSHRSKDLAIPRNIRLVRLPAYAPELNPQEHIWDELREKEFPNRVFDDMSGVVHQLENGLPRLAADTKRLQSIAGWPWIISLNLKAN